MTGTTGRASNTNAGNIEQNLCTANGSSQSNIIYPPQSPTRITNNSILKLAGAFHCVKTSSIRFWAFSYSIGEPCGRSDQLIMYFIGILLLCWFSERLLFGRANTRLSCGRAYFSCPPNGSREPKQQPHLIG